MIGAFETLTAPPDRALPALATALDAAAMVELLAPKLGDAAILRSCTPRYIRYKPRTNCVIQYDLELEDAGGRIHVRIAYAKLYAGERAGRLWSRGSLQSLAATADAWSDDGPRTARVAHLPELGAVLAVYPVDPALRALALAASPAGRRSVLDDLTGQAEPLDGGVELLRYKAARKALLRYDAEGGPVYAKLYSHGNGGRILRACRALEAVGVPLAPALGYLPDLGLIVHRHVDGTVLRELYGTPAFEHGAAAAGEALARLHAVGPVVGVRRQSWAHEGAELTAAAATIGVLRPDLAADAAALAERAVERLAQLPPAAATLHGDFYDDQVLVQDGAAVLLDFDGIQTGHPLIDVGNFLGHLSVGEEDDPDREAFLAGYARAPRAEAELLEGAAILKLVVAPFRRLEPDWPEGVERRLRLAARRLGQPAGARRRRVDTALPQLAVVRDGALIGPALEDVFGEPVEVESAAVVRHKAGRRCTLRYDLLVGEERRPERLYGKTFASDRGPRVHRALSAIAAADAFGTAAVPEPVAYIRSLKLLLQREVPGSPAKPAFLVGDRAIARATAEALAALHGSGVELEHRHLLEDEFAILRTRVEGLEQNRDRARECLARIERNAAAAVEWRLRPVHRDFYPDQLLVDGDRLAVLDLDDAALSEPAVDVANFLAHLSLLAIEEPSHAAAIGTAARAFRARSHALDADLNPQLVRLLESATLLRLACIHDLHARPLIEAADRLLGHVVRARPASAGRRTRLELALDAERIAALVADAVQERTGARLSGCRTTLLHAKKGRVVVRYQFDGGLAIVGKWFPDRRSGRVADVLAALRTHGFAGAAFAVPAPLLHLPELDVLFTDAANGPSLRSVLEADPGTAARAGAWLACFHTCAAALSGACPPHALTRPVLGWARDNAVLGPIARRVAAALRAAPDPALPMHFDYAAADVLVPADGPTTVVDFDDAAMGDPAFDVANFRATLMLRGWRRAADSEAYAAASRAFAQGYEQKAPLPPVSPAIEAAVWLRLAHRCLTRGLDEDVWRFALDRAGESIAQEGGP